MKKDPVIYLSHIHEAITAILNFTRGITEEEFYHSETPKVSQSPGCRLYDYES